MIRTMRQLTIVLAIAASLLAGGATTARADTTGYFEEIAQYYGSHGTRIWSDSDRGDAFGSSERFKFNKDIMHLSDIDNGQRLPHDVEVYVAQVGYYSAKAATEEGLDPVDELEKAIRSEFETEGNLVVAVIDGDELDARAYGTDMSPDFVSGLLQLTDIVNNDMHNQANPKGLLQAWLSGLEYRNQDFWGSATSEPDEVSSPQPTATKTVTVTKTPSPPQSTASQTTAPSVDMSPGGKPWWVWLIFAGLIIFVFVVLKSGLRPNRGAREQR